MFDIKSVVYPVQYLLNFEKEDYFTKWKRLIVDYS